MKRTIKYMQTILFTMLFMSATIPQQVKAYYQVGDPLTQETLDRVVTYCANASQDEPLSQLLIPANGQANRVLLINFFSSW